MAESRISLFRKMLESQPENAPVRFGLANELLKLERWHEAITELGVYLSQADDQGAAYGKLAQALEKTGQFDEAKKAYEQGISAARKHGHPGLAQEFEAALADMI